MKKFVFSMATAILASVSLANASNPSIHTSSASVIINQEKVEIKPEELPDKVREALGAAPYNTWQVQKAYRVPGENETQTFEIALVKGEETSTVKFDNDGKVIE